MKILYVTQYFLTPEQAGGSRHYRHVKYLMDHGHQVDVLTTYVQDHMSRNIPPKYKGKFYVKEYYENISIYKTYSAPNYGQGFLDRLKNYLSFMFFAILLGLVIRGRYDIVFASSPSLFVGWAGFVLSKFKRALFVLEVRDLWPQSAIELGFLKNRLFIWMAEGLEKFLYRKAAVIIALTGGIKDAILKIVKNQDKVKLITNGVDTELYLKSNFIDFRAKYGLQKKFIAMYVGAHGVNNDLETLIDAAEELKEQSEIKFVFIGDGDHKSELMKLCANRGLKNVVFLPSQPKKLIPDYLNAADVCLLAIKKDLFFQGTLPNKLFDYMASGKPVVATVPTEGESAHLIQKLQAGIICAPESGKQMARAILKLYEDKKVDHPLLLNARNYVLQNFSRNGLAAELEQVMVKLSERVKKCQK